ncbi:MAG: hypothetical protein DMF51_00040 [Acidobacteria bacterium]|nr:MAG: hypothetical protein DMF51_00040 [Acidobacteriota bacterium]
MEVHPRPLRRGDRGSIEDGIEGGGVPFDQGAAGFPRRGRALRRIGRMVSEDDPIALLLRLAGPREAAAQKRSGRVRSEVWAHWRTEVRTVRRRRMIFRATVALAAAAAVVVVIARGPWNPNRTFRGAGGPVASLLRAEGSFRLTGGRSLAIGASLLAGSELETGAGGRAALALPGGHSVRLDSETRVRLLSGPALQLDRGALYVDSGPGRPRPTAVEIRTEMGLVRDVGTQFEVRRSLPRPGPGLWCGRGARSRPTPCRGRGRNGTGSSPSRPGSIWRVAPSPNTSTGSPGRRAGAWSTPNPQSPGTPPRSSCTARSPVSVPTKPPWPSCRPAGSATA